MAQPSSARHEDARPGDNLAAPRLADVYNIETGATLRVALLIVGVAALGYLPANIARTGAGARLVIAISCINTVVGLSGWWWTRRHPVPARFTHPVFAALIVLTAISTSAMQSVVKDPMMTTHVVIIIMATGMVLVAWRWFVAAAAISIAAWAMIGAAALVPAQHLGAATSMVLGVTAAGVINLGRRRNIDRLFRANELAETAAVMDALTHVYNRRGLLVVGGQVVRTARRTESQVGVLLVDVDQFKSVNDRLGHNAGDTALIAVARALRAAARESDVVARWGGDEFVVVTLGPAPDPADIVSRVEADLAAHGITGGDGGPMRISVGAASADANEPDILALISHADSAMYAGRAGRRHGRTVALQSYEAVSTGQNVSTGR